MNRRKTIWSLIIVIFVVLIVGIVYFSSKSSFAIFSDEIEGKNLIKLNVSNENVCLNNVNSPVLENNMIPVSYDESLATWIVSDKENQNFSWYNYCDKKWANVVVLKDKEKIKTIKQGDRIDIKDVSFMFVWIPRFKYQIFNYNPEGETSVKESEILLSFEKNKDTTGDIKCEANEDGKEVCMFDQKTCINEICNGKTFTHPGFKENLGFWVSKFELTGNLKDITSVPGQRTITEASVRDFNDSISDIYKKDNLYGFDENDRVYMINNYEWGAISYLTLSKYGKQSDVALNNCNMFITGIGSTKNIKDNSFVCNSKDNLYNGKEGINASTTGNVYGVYDMSGGAYEYVLSSSSNNGEIVPGSSGYTSSEKIDNIILYKKTEDTKDIKISKLGDGIREVNNGASSWYNASNYVVTSKWPWLVRGGENRDGEKAGIFNSSFSSGSKGSNYSTRIVIEK